MTESLITAATMPARAFNVFRTGLIGALILFAGMSGAQEIPDLTNLVLESEPLSTADDSRSGVRDLSAREKRALLDSVVEYLGRIEPQRRAGSSDPELIEQLAFLAVTYQRLDRHEEAIETLEEAVSLTQENGGRNNLEQIPLQEQKIPSLLALNDIRRIDETEELIYSLKEDGFSPGTREMFYATINLADWYTSAYFRENYGEGRQSLRRQRAVINRAPRSIRTPGSSDFNNEIDDQISAPGGNDSLRSIFSGNIRDVFDQDINDERLRKIERLYAGFQESYIEAGNVQLDVLIDIALRVARLAYVTKQEMDFERDNYAFDPNYENSREQAARNSPQRMDESYDVGVEALRYRIDVPRSVTGWRPEALAAALLDLGDWHLAFGKAAAAKEAYREAYQVLLDAGFSSENIDRGLATDLPLQIPVFATHLYTRSSVGMHPDTPLDFHGYADLSFSVDNLGNASDIRFLGRSSEDLFQIERLIERQLDSMKFRPVLHAGELLSNPRVEARYYYSY